MNKIPESLRNEMGRFFILEFNLDRQTEFIEWAVQGFATEWRIVKPRPPVSIFNSVGEIDIPPNPAYEKLEYTTLYPKAYAWHGRRILAAYNSETNTLYYQWK